MNYAQRVEKAFADYGQFCVGIDPHPQLLEAWGLPDNASGLESFCNGILDALEGHCGIYKPQSALFERHGSAGIAVLERVLGRIREAKALSILDVKRGDIGSTMAAYADAYLNPGSSLAADAITLSPYLGFESLRPALDLAQEYDRGVFVLGLTSNPEGPEIQHARTASGQSVAAQIIKAIALENSNSGGNVGRVGMVIGATIGDGLKVSGADIETANGFILAPGIGAQGAGKAQVRSLFEGVMPRLIPTSSRGIASGGPNPEGILNAFQNGLFMINNSVTQRL